MPIVNLTTNLKSLRYGSDRLGAGMGSGSNQPYIKNPIPKGSGPGWGDADFLLRGGSLLPGSVIQDVSRLTQMMFDFKTPNGLLFSIKQNLLSRSAVNIKAIANQSNVISTPNRLALNNGTYVPTSTILQAAANPFGGHLLKQGINPFASTNVVAQGNNLSTGFGGNLPLANPIYLDTAAYNERAHQSETTSRLAAFYQNTIQKNHASPELYSYSGGPGSTLGVGNTVINLSSERTGINNASLNISGFLDTQNNGYNNYSVFKNPRALNPQGAKIFNPKTLSKTYEGITGTPLFQNQYKLTNANDGSLIKFTNNVYQPGGFKPNSTVNGLTTTLNYDQLMIAGNSGSIGDASMNSDFRIAANSATKSIPYTDINQRLDGRVNLGQPGRPFTRNSYVTGRGEALDKINALQIYKAKSVDLTKPVNDLVKFRIGVIDNKNPALKTYIHFRAYLNGFNDSYGAEWATQKFVGRGEDFYQYQGFSREISMGWTVAAQSKQELIPMYQKLNYIASACAPDYSADGYMRGNLIELTVGGYLYQQVGIMKGITFSVPEESPWEIGIGETSVTGAGFQSARSDNTVKELPHIINVSGFSFIPIHNFVPQLQQNTFESLNSSGLTTEGNLKTFGSQRYIALSNGVTTNY